MYIHQGQSVKACASKTGVKGLSLHVLAVPVPIKQYSVSHTCKPIIHDGFDHMPFERSTFPSYVLHVYVCRWYNFKLNRTTQKYQCSNPRYRHLKPAGGTDEAGPEANRLVAVPNTPDPNLPCRGWVEGLQLQLKTPAPKNETKQKQIINSQLHWGITKQER